MAGSFKRFCAKKKFRTGQLLAGVGVTPLDATDPLPLPQLSYVTSLADFAFFFAISDSLWRPNPVTAELCPPFGEPVSQMWLVPPTGPSFWRNYRPSRKPFRKQRHNINSRGN